MGRWSIGFMALVLLTSGTAAQRLEIRDTTLWEGDDDMGPAVLSLPGDSIARALLSTLQGAWRFELFPVGDSEPSATGTRVFRRLLDGLPTLVWTEAFDGRDVRVGGVLGYDSVQRRFYELGAASQGPSDYWHGTLGHDGRSIVFIDPLADGQPGRGRLVVESADRFTYTTPRFRTVFIRSPTPNRQ